MFWPSEPRGSRSQLSRGFSRLSCWRAGPAGPSSQCPQRDPVPASDLCVLHGALGFFFFFLFFFFFFFSSSSSFPFFSPRLENSCCCCHRSDNDFLGQRECSGRKSPGRGRLAGWMVALTLPRVCLPTQPSCGLFQVCCVGRKGKGLICPSCLVRVWTFRPSLRTCVIETQVTRPSLGA